MMNIACRFASSKYPLHSNNSNMDKPDQLYPSRLGKAYFDTKGDIIELKPQLKVSLLRRLTGYLTDEQIETINKYRILPEDTKIVRSPFFTRFCLAPVGYFVKPGMKNMPDDLMARKNFLGSVVFVKVHKNVEK